VEEEGRFKRNKKSKDELLAGAGLRLAKRVEETEDEYVSRACEKKEREEARMNYRKQVEEERKEDVSSIVAALKEETPKEDTPKEEAPKEEAPKDATPKFKMTKEQWHFLLRLQKSGICNMMEAAPRLVKQFKLSAEDADAVNLEYMESYSELEKLWGTL
jgi:hypothetical protein